MSIKTEQSAFITPRTNRKQTFAEMLEAATTLKNTRLQNMQSLTEAHKMNENFIDNTASVLEAAEQQVIEESKKTKVLENMYYRRGSTLQTANKLNMRSNLEAKAGNIVGETALYKIIYEAYYLDEPVKEGLVDSIENTIERTLEFIQENCTTSAVPKTKYSKFLMNVMESTDRITNKAITRIMQTALENSVDDPEFELNEEECDELDGDLSDLGKDDIVELIKSKVASVVQDERERGEARAALFDELDGIENDTKDSDTSANDEGVEPTNEPTEESTILSNTDIMEGMVPRMTANNTIELVPYEYTFETAIHSLPKSIKFTTGEQRILSTLMECESYDITQDPSNDEFKSYVSGMCKAITGQLTNKDYRTTCNLIDEYIIKLSSVSDLDGNTKSYVNAMTSAVYSKLPTQDIIIHRLGKPIGSPDAQISAPIDIQSFEWMDLLVNIRTNLSSIKSWCIMQLRNDNATNSYNTQVRTGNELTLTESSTNPFEQLRLKLLEQQVNQSIGDTLFEAMMLKNIHQCEKTYTTLESTGNTPLEPDAIEKSALVESLLEYTVFETVNTLGIYNFRAKDLTNCKRKFMSNVSEGKSMFHRNDNTGNLENNKKKKRLIKHIIKPHDSSNN